MTGAQTHSMLWRLHPKGYWLLQSNCLTECVKHVLVKNLSKLAEHWFTTTSLSWKKKTVNEVETHWLSGKEKVSGEAVSKEGHADSLLKH